MPLHENALYDCILPTLCERGEWCRFFFFKVARKGAYLPYVTAAGVPLTKGKGMPLHGNALYDCILPTLCERGEWCRVAILKRVRE